MAPEKHQPGAIGAESSWMTGASTNIPGGVTQQQHRHQIVHHNAAIVVTTNFTPDVHWKIVRKTASIQNEKQHAIGYGSVHIAVDDGQLTMYHPTGVRRELRDQLIAASNRKHPWSTKAFVRTVRKVEHDDVARSGIFADEFPETSPGSRSKQALKTLEEATESYMVELIAESHFRSSN